MKRIFLIVSLMICVILIFSCENNHPVEPQTEITEGIIPYKVGYKWTWNVIKNSDQGQNFLFQVTTEVIKDTMINDEKWYILRENNSYNTGPYTNRNGVNYYYYNGEPTISFNTSIEDTSLVSTNSNNSYLISKNNIVEIPLGKFNCYLYRVYTGSKGKRIPITDYYIAYNIGIIKVDDFGCIDSLCNTYSLELASTNVF